MSSNRKTMYLDFEVNAILKNMDKVVSGIKSGLEKGGQVEIDFTKGAGNSLSKLFDKYKDGVSKLRQFTNNEKIDFINRKEALKTAEDVVKSYREIQRVFGDLTSLTTKDAKKLFPDYFDDRVNKASDKLKEFIATWGKLNTKNNSITQTTNDIQELNKEIEKLDNKKLDYQNIINEYDKIRDAANDTTKAVKNLKDTLRTNIKAKQSELATTHDITTAKNKAEKARTKALTNKNVSVNEKDELTYKGKTYLEWEKYTPRKGTKSYDSNTKLKEQAQAALENEYKSLQALKEKNAELEKSRKLSAVLSNFNKYSNEDIPNQLKQQGFSMEEFGVSEKDYSQVIENNVNALNKEADAKKKSAQASKDLANVEKQLNTKQGNYDKKQKDLKKYTDEAEKLEEELKKITTALGKIDDSLNFDADTLKTTEGLERIRNAIQKLDDPALERLKDDLKSLQLNTDEASEYMEQLQAEILKAGNQSKEIKRVNDEVDQLHNQVLQFFSIGNAIELFKRAVRSAFETVKQLDATMTETAVVTDFSVSDMWEQLPRYASEANKLGASINDLYGSTTLYYQQGLKTKEAMELGIETTKMARIANIDAVESTNLMTAALRGFNMELNEASAQNVNDVYSKLAAITAADTHEIGVAMSKTASIANSANMEFETTASLLAQIIETTREAPETAGTAMKTIIARFSEVKSLVDKGLLTGEDEEGEIIDVNKIQGALRSVGISMNEFFAGTEGLDQILLKLAKKWDTLDFTTQRYIATTAAGSRQQSRFIAMMSDYARTQELVDSAYSSAGASQEQFSKTLDSLEAKLTQLKVAWDQFVMGLANNEFIKGAVDLLTGFLNTINGILDAVSGGNGLAKSILSLGMAFGAFKIGKTILGKGGIFAKLKLGLGGKATEEEAQRAGRSIAENLGEGLEEGIDKIRTKGFGNSLLEKIGITKDFSKKDLTKSFGLDQLDFSNVSPKGVEKLKDNILEQVINMDVPEEIKNKIVDLLAFEDGINVKGINEALEGTGYEIKYTGEEAEKAGVKLKKYSASFKTVSTGATLTGLALQGVASIMEAVGADKKAIDTVRQLGSVLMMLGPIAGIVGNIFMSMSKKVQASLLGLLRNPIVLTIVAITGAIIALGVAINSLGQQAKIEKLNEQISALSEEAEKAKTAMEEIADSKSGLEELQNTFEGLTKGTAEWKEKLIEINQQVLELINKYPKLAEYINTTENGALDIKEQGYEVILEGQQNKLTNSLIAQNALQSQVAGLQQEIEFENIFSKKRGEYFGLGIPAREAALEWGSQLSYDISTFLGTFTEDWFGTNVVELGRQSMDTGGLTFDQYSDFITKLAEAGINSENLANNEEQAKKIFTNLGYNSDIFENVFNSTQRLGDTFDELSTSAMSAKLAEDARTEAMYSTIISGSDILSNSEFSQYTQDVVSRSKDYKDLIQEKIDSYGWGLSEDLKIRYADSQGMKLDEVNAQLKDESLSEETIKNTLAAQDATAELTTNMEELAGALEGLQISAEKGSKGINNFDALLGSLTAEGGGMTSEDIAEFESVIAAEDIEAAKKEYESVIGSEAWAEISQYIDFEEIYNNILLGSETFKTATDNLEQYFGADSNEFSAFDKFIDKNNFSAEQVKAFSDALIGINGRGGDTQQALSIIEKLYNSQGLNADEQKIAASILSTTDYSDKDSIEQTIKSLEEMGAVIDDSLIQALMECAEASRNLTFEELQNKLTGLSDTIKTVEEKIENEEVKFTKEEVDKLKAQGIDTSNFVWTGIDEYTYIAPLENLLSSLDENVASILGEMQGDLNEKVANADSIEGFIAETKGKTWQFGAQELTTEEILDKIQNGALEEGEFADGELSFLSQFASGTTALPENTVASEFSKQELFNKVKTYLESNWGIQGRVADENRANNEQFAEEQLDFKYSNLTPDSVGNINYIEASQKATAQEGVSDEAITAEINAMTRAMDAQMASEKGLNVEYERTKKLLKENGRELDISDNHLKQLLINTRNTEKAQDKLNSTLDENIEAFKAGKDSGGKYDAALERITNSAKKVFGDSITTDFVEQNKELFEQLEQGGENGAEAFRKIGEAISNKYLSTLPEVANKTTEIQNIVSELDGKDFSLTGTADVSDIINKLIDAGMTAEQVAQYIKGMGYTLDWDITGYKNIVVGYTPSGPVFKQVPIYSIEATKTDGSGTNNWGGSSGGSGGGGGGGGGSEEDTKTWKNPYDEFYNTTEKINELLRQRNKLEREFNKLASRSATSTEQLNKLLKQQLSNLRQQANSQNYLISGKQKQLQNAINATMSVEEGRTISFQEAYAKAGGSGNISQYGSYNTSTGQIEINWSAIEALQGQDAEQGSAVEEYISYLESISSELEEAQDALEEIEDSIIEIIDTQLEARIELITTLKDALVEKYQMQIDKLSELNNTISDSNDKILNGIQESIDLERQIRDNTKTEEDIAEKEARLAFLRRDTSGANDLEIKQLEEELADARESYSDTLIDQEVDRLSKQNEEAAEARQKQIDLMQAQLDYWQSSDYFNNIIESMNKSEAMALWKKIQDFNDKTEAEKISLMKEWNELWNKGNSGSPELAAADSMYKGDKYTLTDAKGKKYTGMSYNSSNDTWSNGKVTISGSDIAKADINRNTITTNKDLSPKPANNTNTTPPPAPKTGYFAKINSYARPQAQMPANEVEYLQQALNAAFGTGLKVDGIYGKNTKNAVKILQRAIGVTVDGYYGPNTRNATLSSKYKAYASGGLADYTGIAWLDGTKSKPELVLNSKDTQNFIVLKDILSDILKGNSTKTKNSGDNYYDFHITVEEIANDYDVEKMIQKIKEEIHKDSTYRNVNAINLLR